MVIHLKKVSVIFLCAVFLTAFVSFNSFRKSVRASGNISVKLPVVMYHQISKKYDNLGRYVIADYELESDIEYIKSRGYTTVDIQDLYEYVNGNRSLPDKVIMLTFDDGHETVYTVAEPMLRKNSMCGVSSVIGAYNEMFTENNVHDDYYSYMNWDEIKELSASDVIEIQNHSYNLHFAEKGKRLGISQNKNESYGDYYNVLCDDVGKFQIKLEKLTGKRPLAITYPFGAYSAETEEICKKLGFISTLTCEERINTVTKYRPETLFMLGRYNRVSGVSSEEFFKKLLE